MVYDFTTKELNFIIENANFNDRQLEIFNRLTDRKGRQKIYQIAMEMDMSERTVGREIRKIKSKLFRIL